MTRAQLTLVACIGLCACPGPGSVNPESRPAGPPALLTGRAGSDLLQPCADTKPAPADSFWTVDSGTVSAIEAGLAAFIARDTWMRPGHGPTEPLEKYRGQYVGIFRGERRLVYASFVPAAAVIADTAFMHRPYLMCDGGSWFFRFDYDPSAKTFDHMERNS